MLEKDLRILFKIASRERPQRFKDCVVNIMNYKASSNNLILVSADLDDESMYTDDIHKFCQTIGLVISYGKSQNKVHAINRDINSMNYEWDILVNVSDDQRFTEYGFDSIIRQDMMSNAPDLDAVLHYPDPSNPSVMTMSVIGRKYYDRDKYIYHRSYKSFECDREAKEVAIIRKKYKPMSSKIYYHDHPNHTMASQDNLYLKNSGYQKEDELNYEVRRKNNFYEQF